MAQEKIGEVTTPTNATFEVYWDKSTGKVYVGIDLAGNALSKEKALIEANYFATARRRRT